MWHMCVGTGVQSDTRKKSDPLSPSENIFQQFQHDTICDLSLECIHKYPIGSRARARVPDGGAARLERSAHRHRARIARKIMSAAPPTVGAAALHRVHCRSGSR